MDFKSGQKDFKSGQERFQIGVVITNRCRRFKPMLKGYIFSSINDGCDIC